MGNPFVFRFFVGRSFENWTLFLLWNFCGIGSSLLFKGHWRLWSFDLRVSGAKVRTSIALEPFFEFLFFLTSER